MIEKGKISAFQLFCLIVSFLLGSTTILQNINVAGRDTWISSGIALFFGIGGSLMFVYLVSKFPGKNLAEYSEMIFGRAAGTLINLLYVWYFLHLGALVLRNYAELLSGTVMPESKLWLFGVFFGIASAYLVKHKIESMGRLSEIALPITIAVSLLTTVLIAFSNVIDLQHLLPIMEHGIKPVLLGAVPIISFPYMEIVVLAMCIPYINNPKKTKFIVPAGVFLTGVILTMVSAETISIFGLFSGSLSFPRFFAVRLISIGQFINRIEAIMLIVWIMSGLIKIGVCLYASTLTIAHIFRLKDFGFLAIPMTALMVSLSILLYPDIFQMLDFAVNIYPIYAFPFQVILPFTMCVLAKIKFRKKQVPG